MSSEAGDLLLAADHLLKAMIRLRSSLYQLQHFSGLVGHSLFE